MPVTRRHLFLGSLAARSFAKKQPPPPRPGIVVIVADGLGAWMLGCYGNADIRTPNIDRLAQQGVRFANHFTTSPVPEGGRAALTGRLAATLGPAGYECGESETAAAGSFLDRQTPSKPFLLTLTYANNGAAPQRYVDMYAQAKFETMGREPAAPGARHPEMLRDVVPRIRAVAASTTALDDQVPAIYNRLRDRKLLDNTLLIFTASCGALLGRHGLWGDGEASTPPNMYEEVVETPMIWTWLGKLPPGTSRPDVVSAVDFLPSIAEAAGISAPGGKCGRSYLPLAMNKPLPKKNPWRDLAGAVLENTAMVRDNRYKVVSREAGKGPNELYDLSADPREKTNQYSNPQFVTVRDRLSGEMAAWRKNCAG